MSTYTTKQGDMWDSIAYNQLGSVSYTDKLMLKNLAYRHYYTFPAGVVLTLPEVSTTTSSTLPPWKQVST
ncbi:tail protein X [Bengtsoniella intestinalis]|uniref:tail protein X n=1 Tax=Bengtsoniella intestinalis TaxID=3073143 RepID=UPI00391F046E